ncbi:unnamed protein product [Ixodes pacificus]
MIATSAWAKRLCWSTIGNHSIMRRRSIGITSSELVSTNM